jgi:Arc/MetJ family transcription regulator
MEVVFMRTTVDLPENLVQEAFRCSHLSTKTALLKEGLRRIVEDYRTRELRELRGKMKLEVNVDESRGRKSAEPA